MTRARGVATGSIRAVPLGGLGEIGLNLMLLEYASVPGGPPDAAVAIDCGVMFPSPETPGIDLILPDFSYVLELGDRFLGILLTHGHEDHIGGVPFLLRERSVPVWGTSYAIGLVERKLPEHELLSEPDFRVFAAGDRWQVGPFDVEAFHVTHSIADAAGFAIRTPAATIVHTGDFKLDATPVDGRLTDLERLREIGNEGVDLLFSDSTNAECPGTTPSERSVADPLDRVIAEATGRVFAATFASHVHRLQQFVEIAVRHGRRVALLGRSLVQNVGIARERRKIDLPAGAIVEIEEAIELPPHEILWLTTGSQGEPRSALARIATGNHQLAIERGDTVVFSARVIPGNERAVGSVVNHLYRHGAKVFWQGATGIHTSGHASRDELREVFERVRPRVFVPVHGEYRHLVHHVEVAREAGVPGERCFVLEDGETLVLDGEGARHGEPVPAGRVFVDGKGVGDVDAEVVLRDRRRLSRDGIVLAVLGIHRPTGEIVVGPEIVSRGVHADEESILGEAREAVHQALAGASPEWRSNALEVKEAVRRSLRRFFANRFDRRPIVLTFVVEM